MYSRLRTTSRTLCAAATLVLLAPFAFASVYIPLPAKDIGTGGGLVFGGPDSGTIVGQTFKCYVNSTNPNTCSIANSNSYGSVQGTATAYSDAEGFHVGTSASAMGDASITVNASAGSFDYRTNIGNQALQFSMTLGIHAILLGDPNSYSSYELDYYGVLQPHDQPTSWKQFSTGTNGTEYDQVITTPVQTIQPGQTVTEELLFNGTSEAYVYDTHCNVCVEGVTYLDALNTITFQSFNVTDTNGNPVDPSLLVSTDGFSNTPVATGTPEPSTVWLSLAGFGSILSSGRLRSIFSFRARGRKSL